MSVRKVTHDDCTPPEGGDFNPLHSAVIGVCGGLNGDVLWEKIRQLHRLSNDGDCNAWVERMNIAIGIWNANIPVSCSTVEAAYDV